MCRSGRRCARPHLRSRQSTMTKGSRSPPSRCECANSSAHRAPPSLPRHRPPSLPRCFPHRDSNTGCSEVRPKSSGTRPSSKQMHSECPGSRVQVSGSRFQGPGLRVQGSGSRAGNLPSVGASDRTIVPSRKQAVHSARGCTALTAASLSLYSRTATSCSPTGRSPPDERSDTLTCTCTATV